MKTKTLEELVRDLCHRKILESERIYYANRTKYYYSLVDTPDTLYEIIREIRRRSLLPERLGKKIDKELNYLYLEIDRILDKYRQPYVINRLINGKNKRINLKYIIPFLEWMEHGVETPAGKIWVSFYHLKYMNRYAMGLMTDIAKHYSTLKGCYYGQKYKDREGHRMMAVSFYFYPFQWKTSVYAVGEKGVEDPIMSMPDFIHT